MLCNKCGTNNPENLSICQRCGNLLIEQKKECNNPTIELLRQSINNSNLSNNSKNNSNNPTIELLNQSNFNNSSFNNNDNKNNFNSFNEQLVKDNHINNTNNNRKSNGKIKILLIAIAFIFIFVLLKIVIPQKNIDFKFKTSNVSINVLDTYQLELLSSSNVDDVIYSSSDESIATVSKEGLVTAKKEGKVIITAYSENLQSEAKIELIISNTDEKHIYFETEELVLKQGENYQLKLNSNFDFNHKDIVYDVSDKNIIDLNGDGKIVAKNKGVAIVTASIGDISATLKVEIVKEYVVKFELNNAQSISQNQASCTTSSQKCKIKLPTITASDGYKVLGWAIDKNSKKQEFNVSDTIEIDKDLVLYAIVSLNQTENYISMNEYKFPSVTSVAYRKKKVLVIEIDPYLESKGKKVSQFLEQGGSANLIVNNLKSDISYASNNTIGVEIVGREYLNEFPTYKQQVTLLNGDKSYRFDEETYLSVFNNGWYGWWNTNNSDFKKMDSDKLFDYNYILDKFNLVNRKNNKEFDEVWLITIDPASTYETAMIGRTAYWANGEGITKNCDNFIIAGFTLSRTDSPLECLGHASEDIMSKVFGTNLSYDKNNMNITSTNYNSLNLWQKFTLTDYFNSTDGTGLTGVGAIHFTPNSTEDYDWLNSNYVESSWIDWKNNYPYLTGETSLVNYKTWNSSGDESYAGRYFHRWWFSLMPHVSGYTNDGYSNNWWDYLYTLDYVTSVSSTNSTYTYNVGDKINNIVINTKYQSGKAKIESLKKYQQNMIFSNESILKVNGNDEIIAASKGTTNLKYYRDGKYTTITIIIN